MKLKENQDAEYAEKTDESHGPMPPFRLRQIDTPHEESYLS
jgi:hypothetical protein